MERTITITKRSDRFTMYFMGWQKPGMQKGRMTHGDFAAWMIKCPDIKVVEA